MGKDGHNGCRPLRDWEYVVNDFLEIAASLDRDERLFLIRRLRRHGVTTPEIGSYAGFSLDGRLIVVAKRPQFREFWVYDPVYRKIGIRTIGSRKDFHMA